jgi:hypothetical protein
MSSAAKNWVGVAVFIVASTGQTIRAMKYARASVAPSKATERTNQAGA